MAVKIDYAVSFTFTDEQLPALREEAQRRFDAATDEERELAGFENGQFDASNIRHCAQIMLGDPDSLIGSTTLEYNEASWGVAALTEVEES